MGHVTCDLNVDIKGDLEHDLRFSRAGEECLCFCGSCLEPQISVRQPKTPSGSFLAAPRFNWSDSSWIQDAPKTTHGNLKTLSRSFQVDPRFNWSDSCWIKVRPVDSTGTSRGRKIQLERLQLNPRRAQDAAQQFQDAFRKAPRGPKIQLE